MLESILFPQNSVYEWNKLSSGSINMFKNRINNYLITWALRFVHVDSR